MIVPGDFSGRCGQSGESVSAGEISDGLLRNSIHC